MATNNKTEKNPKGAGRKPTGKAKPEKAAFQGVKEGDIRFSTVLSTGNFEDIKNIAYTDRKKDKEVVNEAISEYVRKWKTKNGEPIKRPD